MTFEYLIVLVTGFLICIISLLVGYNLGKHEQPLSPNGQKRLSRIMNRVAPQSKDVGVIERPSAEQNYYRDHPQERKEQEAMDTTLKILEDE